MSFSQATMPTPEKQAQAGEEPCALEDKSWDANSDFSSENAQAAVQPPTPW